MHCRRGCRWVRCASVPVRSFRSVGLCRAAWAFLFKRKRTRRLLTVIITDGASPSIVFLIKAARMANSSFRTPHPSMAPSENSLLGPKSAFFRLLNKKVGEKFGGTNKKPYLCTRKSNKASSLCLARQYAFHDLHSK